MWWSRITTDRFGAAGVAESPFYGAGGCSMLTINSDYAERHTHNKKREERQRLEEKYGNQDADLDEVSGLTQSLFINYI